MRISQNIDDYLCTAGDIPEEKIEGCKAIMDDFAEYYENSEITHITPDDIRDYTLEIFVQMRLMNRHEPLQEALDIYILLRGYYLYLLGRGMIQDEGRSSDAASEGDLQDLILFLARGNFQAKYP
jgi:hypothetical protein